MTELGPAVVYGPPASMGSKRAFKNGAKLITVDVNAKKLRSFQEEMKDAMRETAPDVPLLGPVEIAIVVWAQRPKSHYCTGKRSHILRDDAPSFCSTKPDGDKIARAVLDCGTGIWFRDDSQVARLTVAKRYADGAEPRTMVSGRIAC